MDSSRKSNKIRDIVRLHQLIKKWRKVANNNNNNNHKSYSNASKSINKFLRKTLSFSENSSSSSSSSTTLLQGSPVPVPKKGYITVCVGKDLKRFVIPTEYLSHRVFGILLREAEEEFGFQHEGVLKFPCEADLFEKILKMMGDYKKSSCSYDNEEDYLGLINVSIHRDFVAASSCAENYYSSVDCNEVMIPSNQNRPQMCR